MAGMKAPAVSRDTYKRIKHMDRAETSAFITNIYIKGYEAGKKAAEPNALIDAFRELLISVDSIGPTRADAIMRKFAEKFGAGAGNPQESEQKPPESGNTEEVDDNGRTEESGAG